MKTHDLRGLAPETQLDKIDRVAKAYATPEGLLMGLTAIVTNTADKDEALRQGILSICMHLKSSGQKEQAVLFHGLAKHFIDAGGSTVTMYGPPEMN